MEKPASAEARSGVLSLLDLLLSESLRGAPPAELVRHRILVGASLFLFVVNGLYVLWLFRWGQPLASGVVPGLGYLGSLVLARGARTATAPAVLLLMTLGLGLVGSSFASGNVLSGMHATHMLLPALAVYLSGPRLGLMFALILFVTLGVGHPLYWTHHGLLPGGLTVEGLWSAQLFAGLAYFAAWGLGTLHSTARDAAQTSLERTLAQLGRDIAAREEAEARLGELHRSMMDVSRQAGMAEVATGVLHNVGNTLNSVNVSTGLVIDQLRQSRVAGLSRATQLLREHSSDLATFLTQDPQGQKLPGYLIALSEQLREERDTLLKEMGALSESVEHIKSIVSMQQKHARAAGAVEPVSVPQLIDEALRLNAGSFDRHGILIERDYADVPTVLLDRHKLLQILVNLLSNARHALLDSARQDKRMTIRVQKVHERARLLIEVADNGVGIAPENLPRMFTQGFTTKHDGHGFGLHISALAAEEMKGRLSCTSVGLGQGATFTLEIPLEGAQPLP
ncbi:sensor histidine kinase [Hyalangium rubrum]|uniref:histidine kinase n=1 Tax=Hyalangium rubrum TaxID=3103134 RepID=A0ABU5H5Z9_9BACT|nr:ATP-binding protein [Hyalangium sp. s54d21]MDY7228906.1 ATP-binding protein [Hyalangium sp. s54d21]